MLRCGKINLIQIMKQEDLNYQKSKNTYIEKRWVRDHLPFGFIIDKIA
jgi:hypothetical protein